MKHVALLLFFAPAVLSAQEAASGFDLRGTLTQGLSIFDRPAGTQQPAAAGAFRAVLYPALKLSEGWNFFGAVEMDAGRFSYRQPETQSYELHGRLLQGYVSYSRFWRKAALTIRAGQISAAFGSFLLHYDDADNPLINNPLSYGYYSGGVTTSGLAGAQLDLTEGKADFRAQFLNSSPANPRSVFARDQYGTWAGGAGYTIRQGFRVGVSAYRGPYLDRHSPFYFPGEAPPRDLPATAFGVDAQWGWRHLNISGEWQHFDFIYHAMPAFREQTGYVELREVLHPRWYVASRLGYIRGTAGMAGQSYELVAGFRPNRRQIIKVGYDFQQGPAFGNLRGSVFSAKLVTTFHAISIARD